MRVWAPPLGLIALLALSSFGPSPAIWLARPPYDRIAHLLQSFVLGWLAAHAAARSWPERRPIRVAAVGALVAVGVGLLIELAQAFLPHRSAELGDLLADLLGAVTGAAGSFMLRRSRARVALSPSEIESEP
ncbi:MAG: VanZ family protein [Myxococcales bacterium]|nr:VanZ family protein [Myxococcales bacterium]